MSKEIIMPSGGQNALESLIVRWEAKEGDYINRGDLLFEIETDKATMAVESFAEGTLLKIVYPEGESVEAGKVVAYIGEAGEQVGATETASEPVLPDDEYQPIIKQESEQTTDAKVINNAPENTKKEIKTQKTLASPKARWAAKMSGKDIDAVFSTVNGKVVKASDVEAYTEKAGVYRSESLTQMRKTIARRMLESVHEAPQFTVSVDVDMDAFVALRKQINQAWSGQGVRVSLNDLLVKAVCIAAKKYPYINAKYTDEEICINDNTHVGLAVALPNGLMVPVIKNADMLSIREIAHQSASLIKRTKDGKIAKQELEGGTITISNLGSLGIKNFTAIINRPESAILAVGSILEKPVVHNGDVIVRSIMDITATFDHRIIDGYVGAQFLMELKRIMETPVEILL